MAQKPYCISVDDAAHAIGYLQPKLLVLEYVAEVSPLQAAKAFNAITLLPKAERAEALNKWCEQLAPVAFTKLRFAIRKRRSPSPTVAVSVSTERYERLTKLASRQGISVAALLESILAKV